MNKKGFVPVIILLIVAVILIAGGIGYYEIQKPSSVSSPAPASTTNVVNSTNISATTSSATSTIGISTWLTYHNDKYGYDISYPKEAHLDTTQDFSISINLDSYLGVKGFMGAKGFAANINVASFPNPNNLSIHDYVKYSLVGNVNKYDQKDIIFAGETAVVFTTTSTDVDYIFPHNGRIMFLHSDMITTFGNYDLQISKEIINKFIATRQAIYASFKFTN